MAGGSAGRFNSAASVSGRALATKLAHTDPKEAFDAAERIDDAWYAAQAFAAIARFAGEALQAEAFAASRAAAGRGKDAYQQCAVLAWPLRAAIEVRDLNLAASILNEALRQLGQIDYFSSRAEAMDLLFQAAYPGGMRL